MRTPPVSRSDLVGRRFSRFQRRLAKDDSAAVLGDGPALGRRRGARHDDGGRDAAESGGEGERLGVVAGAVRDDAAGGRLGVELPHGVPGAAELEGADLLQMFALEEERPAREPIERPARQHRRHMGIAGDALGRGPDVVQRDGHRRVSRNGGHPLGWVK